jgi:hypothetical protein
MLKMGRVECLENKGVQMQDYQNTDLYLEWRIPEGVFAGTLIEFGEYHQQQRSGRCKKYFRLVFDVEVPDDPYKEYRAQKRYSLNDKLEAAVLKDLKRWLGKKEVESNPNLRLADQLGRKAMLTIAHLQGEGYKHPFSVIKKIGHVKAIKKATGVKEPATV